MVVPCGMDGWDASFKDHTAGYVDRLVEEVKRKGEEDDFVAAKQKMLNAEKGRIQ